MKPELPPGLPPPVDYAPTDYFVDSAAVPLASGVEASAAARVNLASAVIMMVDDEPLITEVTQTYLEEAGYQHFVCCHDPRHALALMRRHRPSLVLLDLMMPEVSGFSVLEQVRDDPELRFIPIIVLTSASGPDTKLRALELGATEFLSKPVDPSELVLRVRNTLAFKLYQDRLASMDPLTGFANRQSFMSELQECMQRVDAQDSQLGLLHIDLDQFRVARETLGPMAADRVIKATARRLKECLRRHGQEHAWLSADAGGRIARIGNQEFALMLWPLTSAEAAATLAKHLLNELAAPIDIDGHQIFTAPVIGIALFPSDGIHAEALVKSADLACSKALASGRNRFAFFSEELTVRSLERLTISNQLRRALEHDELRVYYQPKLAVGGGRIVGAEALVRWQHPEHGLWLPGKFIPIAEDTGLIADLGAWVLARACRDAAGWAAAGLGPLKVAVNVSKPQFENGRFYEQLRACLLASGLPPQQLVVEITESILVSDNDSTLKLMHELKAMGVSLSIDDFGTGYSSLSYLKRLPVDELKVDRSFILDLPDSREDVAIVRTVVALGQSLDMRVVAEGVERPTQLQALGELGCDTYQGFLFSKAVPNEEFIARVRAHHAAPDGP